MTYRTLIKVSSAIIFFSTATTIGTCAGFSIKKMFGIPKSKTLKHHRSYKIATVQISQGGNNENDDKSPQSRKMADVRLLQNSFYNNSDDNIKARSLVELKVGLVKNLPLWRVQWTELPGRQNVLNIHDPTYTNMFETILHQPKPWYFGHFLVDTRYDVSNQPVQNKRRDRGKLKTWSEEILAMKSKINETNDDQYDADDDYDEAVGDQEENANYLRQGRSCVVGTLVRIVDFRRVDDGRLLLLVQAMERILVSNILQEEFQPYIIADVQILPDFEEISIKHNPGDPINHARTSAIAESFRHHYYEYKEDVCLPSADNMNISFLKKIIPFASFSGRGYNKIVERNLNERSTEQWHELNINSEVSGQTIKVPLSPAILGEDTLEQQLIQGGILREPPVHPEVHRRNNLNSNELEILLWINIDEFVRVTSSSTTIAPELLSLLPFDVKWPRSFVLEKMANEYFNDFGTNSFNDKDNTIPAANKYKETPPKSSPTKLHGTSMHDSCRVDKNYPSYRRQKRLSFVVPVLLENSKMGGGALLRQILLEIPTTQGRLSAILERFEILVSSHNPNS